MASPFVAEIRIFAGNFPPRGNAFCNGQLLAIAQNTALFSLLGTNFGGNGTSNFGLPNLQGSAPLGFGQGPGLSNYFIGQSGGTTTVQLLASQLPQHQHTPAALSGTNAAPVLTPAGNVWAVAGPRRGTPANLYATTSNAAAMNATALGSAGGGGPHNNLQPYLALSFIIALQGIFPARN